MRARMTGSRAGRRVCDGATAGEVCPYSDRVGAVLASWPATSIMRFFDFEPGFLEPTKIGHARIVKKRLTFSEPAPDPSHSHLGIGTETERDHEYHREAGQGPSCPPGSILQMTTRCANARWIETDHDSGGTAAYF